MTIIFLRVSLVFHLTMFCCVIFCFMSVSCNNVLCHFSCDMFDIVSSLNASGEGQSLKKQCSSKLAQLSPNSNSIRWQRIVHISKSPHARPWQCFQMLQTFCQGADQIFKKIKQICFILKSRLQSGGTYNWQWDKFMAKKKEIARQRQETNEWKS